MGLFDLVFRGRPPGDDAAGGGDAPSKRAIGESALTDAEKLQITEAFIGGDTTYERLAAEYEVSTATIKRAIRWGRAERAKLQPQTPGARAIKDVTETVKAVRELAKESGLADGGGAAQPMLPLYRDEDEDDPDAIMRSAEADALRQLRHSPAFQEAMANRVLARLQVTPEKPKTVLEQLREARELIDEVGGVAGAGGGEDGLRGIVKEIATTIATAVAVPMVQAFTQAQQQRAAMSGAEALAVPALAAPAIEPPAPVVVAPDVQPPAPPVVAAATSEPAPPLLRVLYPRDVADILDCGMPAPAAAMAWDLIRVRAEGGSPADYEAIWSDLIGFLNAPLGMLKLALSAQAQHPDWALQIGRLMSLGDGWFEEFRQALDALLPGDDDGAPEDDVAGEAAATA